jgi:hypothetical protein
LSIRQFSTGLSHSLTFDFWNTAGARTPVDNPLVDVLTPQKTKYINAASLTTTSVVGQYAYTLFLGAGVTIGHWFARGIGLTTNDTLYSESQVFEVINYEFEPLWVGLPELRQYMSKDDDDRSDDQNLRQCLQTAIELCEGHTRRHYGIYSYHEIVEVKDTDRVKLKKFPIDSLVGITATSSITPRDTTNLLVESISGALVSFYYRLDSENGVLYLTDSAGYDYTYDGVLLSIDYQAGYATIPEPVRTAVLKIAAALFNMICTEGLSYVKIGSMSFATERKLFDGPVGDMLAPFINNAQV